MFIRCIYVTQEWIDGVLLSTHRTGNDRWREGLGTFVHNVAQWAKISVMCLTLWVGRALITGGNDPKWRIWRPSAGLHRGQVTGSRDGCRCRCVGRAYKRVLRYSRGLRGVLSHVEGLGQGMLQIQCATNPDGAGEADCEAARRTPFLANRLMRREGPGGGLKYSARRGKAL